MEKNFSLSSLLLLTTTAFVYATTGIYNKLASMQEALSWAYFEFLLLVVFVMGIYAVLWQLVLKRVPLSQAYLFKSMSIVFSLFFAWSLFHEVITTKNLVGCALIIAGIMVSARQQTS